MKPLAHAADLFTTGTLVLCGMAAVAVSLAGVFNAGQIVLGSLGDPHQSLLFLLGVLSLALGVERAGRLRTLERSVSRVQQIASQAAGGRYLRGVDEIYADAISLVGGAQRRIRSLIALEPDKSPPSFAEAVARRLQDSSAAGYPVQFDVVFAGRLSELPQDFVKRVESRYSIYERAGVDRQLARFMLDTNPTVTFDVLIIDDTSAFVTFPVARGASRVQMSLAFENHSIVPKELAEWFDQRVKDSSIPYEQWKTAHG